MRVETKIKLNKFVPRPYQLPVIDAIENKGYRRVVAIFPRRAGKDITAWNLMIRCALRKIGVYYYIFPTYAQAKKVIWDSITNSGFKIIDYIPEELVESKNSQEMKIILSNGSLIQLVGSTDYDRLMGTNPQGCVFSEYAMQDPRAYQYIRPILTANNGWALFISTPRGKNSLFELYQIAVHSKDWFATKLTVHDTGHIPMEEIEKERAEGIMSDDLIQQEYFCFPGDTGILTDRGVKRIDAICVDDLVVAHSGRLRRVLGAIKRHYSGKMIEISSYGSYEKLVCTPNHPIRVYSKSGQTYSWKEAGKININDRVVFPKLVFGKLPIISYELCMLMAWYITEGSSFKNGLQFSLGNEKEVERVVFLVSALGFKYKIYRGTAYDVVVNSTQLIDFFRSNCGSVSSDRRIPFHLISGHQKEFFSELIVGDGCISVHKGYKKLVYSTISKSLAYDIQLLAHSLNLGFGAGITRQKACVRSIKGRDVNCAESYTVNISFLNLRSRNNWLQRSKYSINAAVKSVREINFEGDVYNLKVQYDESYVANGRAVHNCSFNLGVEGAYYSKMLDRLRTNGQISMVPHENGFKVHTAWDLGVRDSTTIIFFQVVGQTIRVIDCYENSKVGLDHYASVLSQKGYVYGKHIAPHDIRVREFTTGITRIEKARRLGINFTIADNIPVEDGIEAVRSVLPRMWFDEQKCAPLIKAIENYRQEFDVKKKVYKRQPLHNWASHFADSLRYLCVSLPKTRDGLSAEELDRRYREAVYGESEQMPAFFRDGNIKY